MLEQLDGKTSCGEIKERFDAKFAPVHVSVMQVLGFSAQLHEQGLVLSEQHDQGERLLERRRKGLRQQYLQSFANPLAIRFRGIDATRLIDFCYPVGRQLLRPTAVIGAVVLIVIAVALLTGQSAEVMRRLPRTSEFFSSHNIILMMMSLVFIKILHELGHAIACRYFGGECNEIGLMLLVMTPCLYCNVSDAWMFPNKWHRIAVSFAGIYVELVLAAVAAVLWYFSEPGIANSLFLNTVVICTLGTVLLNGNPLLRYDGYFVLSDLLEIPNLAEQSR